MAISKFTQYFGAIPALLQQIANITILMAGVYLILDGVFTIGMLLAFQGFLTSFLSPVNQLIDVGQSFITMRSSMERVEDVLIYQPDDPDQELWPVDNEPLEKLSGEIEIKNITFGYNKLSEPLIKDFSLSIKPGSAVAIVGAAAAANPPGQADCRTIQALGR